MTTKWQKVNAWYHTRDWRGPEVFVINSGGTLSNGSPAPQLSRPDPSYINANSWHRPVVPDIPIEAKFVKLLVMFVGGVKPDVGGSFMYHIDFRDPYDDPPWQTGNDWGDTPGQPATGQGDFYLFYSDQNERVPFGEITVPCMPKNGQSIILLRWRLMSGSPERMYNNAYGINIWCQGYGD